MPPSPDVRRVVVTSWSRRPAARTASGLARDAPRAWRTSSCRRPRRAAAPRTGTALDCPESARRGRKLRTVKWPPRYAWTNFWWRNLRGPVRIWIGKRWRGRLTRSSLLHPRLAASVQRVDGWMEHPMIHLFNNVDQWETVFEIRPGEPTPAAIAPKPADYGYEDPPPGEEGLEAPSSFWPKFEHRFRPAEETWFAAALPAALRAGKTAKRRSRCSRRS